MTNRTAVFIDGPNTYHAIKALGFDMDYAILLEYLEDEFEPLLRATYYTIVEDDGGHQDIVKLLDFLQYNGYSVYTKPVRVYENGESRSRRGDVAVDLAVDIITTMSHVANIVLFSGDVNLKRPVQIAQQNGCRVTVISTNATSPRVVSDELRRVADDFIDLQELIPQLTRKPKTAAVLVKR